jgi:hypothetical protein
MGSNATTLVSPQIGRRGRPPVPARRRTLWLLGAAASTLVVLGLALRFFRVDSFRPRVQAAASQATGLEIRIVGKMALTFFPFGVSARDVHVGSKGTEIGSAEDLELGIELLPLLKKELVVTRCALVRPVVTIVRAADGHLDVEGTAKRWPEGRPAAAFRLKDLELSQGVFTYLDERTKERTELRDLELTIHDLVIPAASSGHGIRSTSLEGSFVAGEVRAGDLNIEHVKSPIKMEEGVLSLAHLTMDVYGSRGEGAATVDLSEVDAAFAVQLHVPNLDFAKLQESVGAGRVIGGKGTLHASLTMKERRNRALLSSVDGTLSLRGDNLVTYTVDLDKALSSYESSQKFHLVDIGAFFIAGPVGVVALKGYGYGKAYSDAQGGQGAITQFISHWKITDGVAEAIDCALATRHHRVALKGRLDLVAGRYGEGAMVALLDDRGCAIRKQSIVGPLGSPQVGATGAAESLGGPFLDLYNKARRVVQGGKCEVFYRGAVQQPAG